MKVHLHLIGVQFDIEVPGRRTYIYWAEGEHGEIDTIRDEDYVEDGEYEVKDTFFDDIQPKTMEDDEW